MSAFIVYRSGSVLPMAVAHAISNLLTVLMWGEAVPGGARSAGLACILGLLVLATAAPAASRWATPAAWWTPAGLAVLEDSRSYIKYYYL